jgi:hypothetical protein
LEREHIMWALTAAGDIAAILGALLSASLFFTGVGSVPDSFLANIIAVGGIASGVIVVVVPVGLHTLRSDDPFKLFLDKLARPPESERGAASPTSELVAKALFVSVVPSPLSFLGDTVLSFVVSVGLALYSNLHGDDRLTAYAAFALLVLGFLLLVEASVAILIVRRSGHRAASRSQADSAPPRGVPNPP